MKIIKLALLAIVLAGCGYSERKLMKEAEYEARDQKHDQFIKLKDGKLLTFNDLKFKVPLVGDGKSHFEGDGKRLDIKYDDILEFQTDKYFVVMYPSAGFLYDVLYKLRSGKIELFVGYVVVRSASGAGKQSTSSYSRNFSVRKGPNGQMLPLNKSVLKFMIQDNKNVLAEFDEKYKTRYLLRNVMEIIDDYN